MEKTPTRVELERYLTVLDELESRREARQINDASYRIERSDLQMKLMNRNSAAWIAVNAALRYLLKLPIFDPQMSFEILLLKHDDEAFRAWRRRFIRANLGSTARRLLEIHEELRVPPPQPESGG